MRNTTLLKFLLPFLLIFFALNLAALEFQNITTKDGLSNRRVFGSAVDKKGFMWFATRVGVDKFDGQKFHHYDFSKDMNADKMLGIISDRKGNIYAFTEKNIFSYDDSFDSFSKIKSVYVRADYGINTLYFDIDNGLWIGTKAGLFYSNDYENWSEIVQFKNVGVNCFTDDKNGHFWIGTFKGFSYLQRIEKNKYNFQSDPSKNGMLGQRVQSLLFDKVNNRLWIGTFSKGLFLYDLNNKVAVDPRNIFSTSSPIRSITEVNNKVWMGSDGGGISEFDLNSATLLNKYTQTSIDGTTTSNSIYHLLNANGKIWVATYTSGVLLCDFSTISQTVFKNKTDVSNSLHNNHVNAVLEDAEGNLWFGTNSGLSKYNIASKNWSHFFTEKGANESVVILTLCEDQNNIWAGGFATELYCINKKSGAVSTFNSEQGRNLNGNKKYIYSILQDENKNIWFGGNLNQLTQFNPSTKAVKQYNIFVVNKICEYNADSILVSSNKGLYVINKKTNRVSNFSFSNIKEGQTSISSFINSIYVDPIQKHTVWLGSEGSGLYRIDFEKKKLRRFTTKDGLSSNYVYGVLSDRHNRLWISTENGLNCFNPKNRVISTYFDIDGLPDNTFNFLAYTKCKNGSMIWGTPEGAVSISPDHILKANSGINLRMTAFNLFYQKVNAATDHSPLEKSIDDTKSFELKHNQNSFSFEFSDLNFSSNPQILYSWKLEGFEDNWSAPSKEHKAVYTNISPGKYIFMVKAYKLGNNQYSSTRSLEIRVNRPFWFSNIALLLYVFLLVYIANFIKNFLKSRLEAQQSEEKIRFFINMAHDVRTPIALIKAPLNEIENENLTQDGRSALVLAQRNLDKLFNLVTQLLDFQKADKQAMRLLVENTQLNAFVKSIVDNFKPMAKEKQIELSFNSLIDETEVWIDRKKISLCLENLLSNAIKYSSAKGKVKVQVSLTSETFVLEVTDNGIGIPQKDQKKLFDRFYRAENAANSNETGSGIGLMLTKKIVLFHKGKITFNSVENEGTSFKIEIPFREQDYKPEEIIQKEARVEQIENGEDAEASELKGVKILLVEDNDELRNYLSKQLRRDYDVEVAINGNDALEKIKSDAPDFILSDIMMPGMSGIELCTILKKKIDTCHIPLILLSALSEREDVIKGLNAGADDYITKPFDLTILQSKIKAIIKNRKIFKSKYISRTAKADEFATINKLDKEFMEKVIQLIEDNLTDENFTIDNLAHEMAMSRSPFYKKLKALTDDNPKDIIKEIKMKKAAELLREQKYPIAEVAFLTGFPNAKYFSTAFKKFYGVSPSRFIEGEDVDLGIDESENE